MTNNELTTKKLRWVHAHLDEKTGETVYMGCFEDGFMDVIRRSFRTYVSVAQLERWSRLRGEFIFSSKPSVPLGRAQRPRLASYGPEEEISQADRAGAAHPPLDAVSSSRRRAD